jgi:4-amino-4-deoxy-L-arabinose transferase-like glycosyltransferase
LAITIAGTATLARRLGLSPWLQQAAALLTASAPVALGMAGTVMPDIPATMFTVLGMERYLSWIQDRRWGVGLAAAVLLALAVLTRVNLLVLLVIAGLYGVRHSWRTLVPLMFAIGLVLLGFVVTRDPNPGGGTAASAARWQLRFGQSGYHLVAFITAYLTTTPILAGIILRRRLEPAWLLWLWLLVPLPIVAYIHFAPKYVLPALPVAAILAAYGLERLRFRRIILVAMTVAGTVLGVLILQADARMSGMARKAAATLIPPYVEAGKRVWFAGHWGFHWYAEAAGATALSLDPPYPETGDLVLHSTVDRPAGLLCVLPRALVATWGSPEATGQVMNGPVLAGFYSDYWGFLPWSWGPPDGWQFSVWRVTAWPPDSSHPAVPPIWCSK